MARIVESKRNLYRKKLATNPKSQPDGFIGTNRYCVS